MRKLPKSAAALLLALSLILAACGGDDDTEATDDAAADDTAEAEDDTEDDGDDSAGGVSGEVNLDGSSTVGPLSEVAAEAYQEENPDVTVSVGISGTGGGFERFCIGETDGNNSSRQITDEEAAICEENGISYDFVTVANDALSVIVNPDFPLECMTVEQLSQVWRAEDFATTWGDVDGADFPDDFASEEILAYGPGTDSGTFDYFTDEINGDSGNIRDDFINIGEDDQAAVNAIAGDEFAIGYTPFSFAVEAGDAVKQLAIDSGDGCVEASLDNVMDATYTPLGRGLFVYFSDTALARPEVLDFAQFYVENAPDLAEIAEFIPLTDEQIEEALAKIESLTG